MYHLYNLRQVQEHHAPNAHTRQSAFWLGQVGMVKRRDANVNMGLLEPLKRVQVDGGNIDRLPNKLARAISCGH